MRQDGTVSTTKRVGAEALVLREIRAVNYVVAETLELCVVADGDNQRTICRLEYTVRND